MLWDGLRCVTGRGKSTDGSWSFLPPLTLSYATIFQISSPPTFQPCRAPCLLEALGYSMTEVNIKTRIPPTASLQKHCIHRYGGLPTISSFCFCYYSFFKTIFLPPLSFHLCRSQAMYFITSDTYVKNVKPFKNTLFWPSALWALELSSIYSGMCTHKEICAAPHERWPHSHQHCLCNHLRFVCNTEKKYTITVTWLKNLLSQILNFYSCTLYHQIGEVAKNR